VTKVYLGGVDSASNQITRSGQVTIRKINIYAPRNDEDLLSAVTPRLDTSNGNSTPWPVGVEGAVFGGVPPSFNYGILPYTFALAPTSNPLPSGLTVDSSTGKPGGTPAGGSAGTYTGIVIRCTDSIGAYADWNYGTIDILPTVGSDWVLYIALTPSANVNHVTIYGLDFNEVRILADGVGTTNYIGFGYPPQMTIQASPDNGTTYLNTTGDYVLVGNDGTELASERLWLGGSGELWTDAYFLNWNATQPKVSYSSYNRANTPEYPGGYMPTTLALDTMSLYPVNSVFPGYIANFDGTGTIYVFVRNR